MTMTRHWRRRINFYRLKGYRCNECGRMFFPRMYRCVYCGSKNIAEIDLPRRGRLLSYTIVYSATDTSKFEAPVVLGLVDLGGTRIISEITDVDPDALDVIVKEGLELEPVLRRIGLEGESGVIYYAVKFRPSMGVEGG